MYTKECSELICQLQDSQKMNTVSHWSDISILLQMGIEYALHCGNTLQMKLHISPASSMTQNCMSMHHVIDISSFYLLYAKIVFWFTNK